MNNTSLSTKHALTILELVLEQYFTVTPEKASLDYLHHFSSSYAIIQSALETVEHLLVESCQT